MKDVIVEPIREVRERLIVKHGGIGGYIEFCQAQIVRDLSDSERGEARLKM